MKENPNPRREFLKKSGLTLFAGAVVPNIIVNKSYGMKKETILGHGSHQYKVIEGWGNLDPAKNPVNDCHEMVEDAKGRLILLTNETKNNVIIYDKSGKLLETWGSTYPGAHGLTISDEGGEEFLYIADNTRSQVIKTGLKGREIMVMDYPRETGNYEYPKQFVPTETAINPANGDIYIVDGYGKNYVTQYNAKGELIRQFGGKGETNETFNC